MPLGLEIDSRAPLGPPAWIWIQGGGGASWGVHQRDQNHDREGHALGNASTHRATTASVSSGLTLHAILSAWLYNCKSAGRRTRSGQEAGMDAGTSSGSSFSHQPRRSRTTIDTTNAPLTPVWDGIPSRL